MDEQTKRAVVAAGGRYASIETASKKVTETKTTSTRTTRTVNVAAYTKIVNGRTVAVAGYSYTR